MILLITKKSSKIPFHITYPFYSESTLCSCLNVKELLAWKRCDIWSVRDCNKIQTSNHLICGFESHCSHSNFTYCACFEQEVPSTTDCRFTLKCACDMIRTQSQMYHTDKYSQHSSITWSVWLNGWEFVCKLSGCGFESHCSHLSLFIFSVR